MADMAGTIVPNEIKGSGQHSHEVPSTPWLVVHITDGNHGGTDVWRAGDDGSDGFFFASRDMRSLEHAERCVYVVGQDANALVDCAYGCDLETPRGVFLIGVSAEDDLSWITKGAEVLWDSSPAADHASAAGEKCHGGEDGLCQTCGVDMTTCAVCGGIGYHRAGCAESDG